jgi:hypothetical protein
VLDIDKYPLPRSADLFATLAGGEYFSKIDLSQAYQQMLVDTASKELLTINTHRGLYQYNRLPFGVASAPAIFQQAMDTLLQGVQSVICYLDDILVTGKNIEEHLHNLEEVLNRLAAEGITVRSDKCKFIDKQVEYLGHIVDKQGIHTDSQKVKAICDAPSPENLQQLRALLGLINYYGKFIPRLATVIHPLNELLRKDVKWEWSEKCQKAFEIVKSQLLSSTVLVHYDSKLPIQLATDASAYGLGAVISVKYPDGTEYPIAFASRTLSQAERKYSQIEKEALSIIFGIKKFN